MRRVALLARYSVPMTTNETITSAVISELDRQSLERQELARRIGVTPAWVSKKLLGQRRWTADDMDRVAGALGVPVAWLVLPRELVGAVTPRYQRLVSRISRLWCGRGHVAGLAAW